MRNSRSRPTLRTLRLPCDRPWRREGRRHFLLCALRRPGGRGAVEGSGLRPGPSGRKAHALFAMPDRIAAVNPVQTRAWPLARKGAIVILDHPVKLVVPEGTGKGGGYAVARLGRRAEAIPLRLRSHDPRTGSRARADDHLARR